MKFSYVDGSAGDPVIEIRRDGGRQAPRGADGQSVLGADCDESTLGHMERTGDIAAHLASRLGLSAGRVERLRRAARLHDVGKSGIDPEVLGKPGPLDPDEYAEVKRHTLIGHRLLAVSGTELSWLSALIALTHHERFDGRGYPHGLPAQNIPIESRIVAVADVFDALLSDRPYRGAVSIEETMSLIEAGSGTQFDPVVADVAITEAEMLCALRR